ncbi:Prenylcysteine oxidase [Heterocephalus glaber]|uniref:Prenylcysteine oxidase 1 n=1 Tax=Heterocephalus glaber TaxID=10181 RepID=G5C7E3_HETGA|nr:Prenylcysteine oxidase [Heterocephalus glaber]
MKPFVKDLGLSMVPASGGLVEVYSGETLVFEESSWFIINMIKLVWHCGFQTLRMHMWVEDVLDKCMRLYRNQSHDCAFSSVEKLLHAVGGDGFLGLLNHTLHETLQKAGFAEKFLSEMVAPIMKVNYGQSTNISAFAPAEMPPAIVLCDWLYYLNGIGFAVSAMEMSAIAGYNATVLTCHRWNGHTDMIDQDGLYEKLKTEL